MRKLSSVFLFFGIFTNCILNAQNIPELVLIPSGSFEMGSNNGESDEIPVHTVTINKFYMSKYEITYTQFDEFCEDTGRQLPFGTSAWPAGRGNRPVVYVSWNDAIDYCEWLSEKTGEIFRLPSEAEWEYSCRAGTQTSYYFGNTISSSDANFDLDKVEFVGSYAPNDYGLYDMHGNAWEFCEDTYFNDAYSNLSLFKVNTSGNPVYIYENSASKVIRGGSGYGNENSCRSANRSHSGIDDIDYEVGFRVAKSIEDLIDPTVPDNLSIDKLTSTEITLSWNASTDNVAVSKYEIFQVDMSSPFTYYIKIGETVNTYFNVPDVVPETEYTFCVKAVDSSGNKSGYSNLVTSVTPSGGDNTAPTTPGNFRVPVISSGNLPLVWDASTDDNGVSHYEVYNGSTKLDDTPSTYYYVRNLTPETQYTFKLRAVDTSGNVSSFASVTVTTAPDDTTPPSIPENFRGFFENTSDIKLYWSPSSDNIGVRYYAIYRGEDNSLVGTTSATNLLVTGVSHTTMHRFKIKAYDYEGNTAGFGSEAIVMPENYDTEAPTIPQNCIGAGLSEDTVRLAWNASTDNIGIHFYAVYHSEDNSLVATTPYTSFVIRGLQQYVTYKYKIKAFDFADNRSGFSNEVQVRTLVPDNEAPTAPGNLQAAGASATSIRLTWEPSTDNIGVRYYAVYRYEDSALLGTSYTTEFTLGGLSSDKTYNFRIKAFDFNGNKSPFSNVASTETLKADSTPPTAPTNLKATPLSDSEIQLTWNASTDDQGVKMYAVYMGPTNTLAGTTTTTQFTVSGLNAATEYIFKVKAFDFNDNRSGFSNEATTKTYGDLNIYKTALYIPRVLNDDTWETTIGIVNPHEENVEFTMYAFKTDGSILQGATYTLIKRRKISQRVGLWFRDIDDLSQVAWVFIGAPKQLQGYAEYKSLSGHAAMMTEALMSKTDFLSTPYIPEDLSINWGQVGVVNLKANQSVGYDSGDSGYSGIPGLSTTNSQSTIPLGDYFSPDGDIEKKYGSVKSSDKAIAAFQMTGSTTKEQASAFTLKGAPTGNLYYLMGDTPHGNWKGVLYNVSSLDAEIHVIAYNAYGSKLTETTFTLAGKTVMKGELEDFVSASNISHIVISSDRNVYGTELIEDALNENSAGLSAGYQVSDELYFNNIKADVDHITELTLANFGDDSNSVTLYCYDVNGNVVLWGRVALRGHQKMTGTLSELLGMEIPETVTRVKALGYQPMAGVALITNSDNTTLSTMAAHPGNYEIVEVTFGTDGGTITNGDATATIPQGALTTETAITLSETPADANTDGVTEILGSTSYTLEPAGLELEEPIQVTIPVDDAILQQIENGELSEEDLVLVAWNIDLGVWEQLENTTFTKHKKESTEDTSGGSLSAGITSFTTYAVGQSEDLKDISLTVNFTGPTNKFSNKSGWLIIKKEPDFGIIETLFSTDNRYDFYIKYFQKAANGIKDDETLIMFHVNNPNTFSWDSSDTDMYKIIKKYLDEDLWCFYIPENGSYASIEDSCTHASEITFWTMTFSEMEFDKEKHKIIDILIPGQINTFTTEEIKNDISDRSYFPGKIHFNSIALDRTDGTSPSKDPLLLIHGINGTSNEWGDNPQRLREKGYDVWVATLNGCGIENMPKTAEEIKYAVQYMYDEYDREIDVVTHSYGGVTARYYCLDPDDNSWDAYSKIDDLVMVGPPHHGSLAADRCYNKDGLVLIQRLGYFSGRTLDINAPIYKELTPGSKNLMKMKNNSFEDGVVPVVFAGIKNNFPGINNEALFEFDDFVVSVASASLLNCDKPVPLGIIDYTHTAQPTSEELFNAIDYYLNTGRTNHDEILEYYTKQEDISVSSNSPSDYNPYQGVLIIDTSNIQENASVSVNLPWIPNNILFWISNELTPNRDNSNIFYPRNNIKLIPIQSRTSYALSGLSLDLNNNLERLVEVTVNGEVHYVKMLAGCTTIETLTDSGTSGNTWLKKYPNLVDLENYISFNDIIEKNNGDFVFQRSESHLLDYVDINEAEVGNLISIDKDGNLVYSERFPSYWFMSLASDGENLYLAGDQLYFIDGIQDDDHMTYIPALIKFDLDTFNKVWEFDPLPYNFSGFTDITSVTEGHILSDGNNESSILAKINGSGELTGSFFLNESNEEIINHTAWNEYFNHPSFVQYLYHNRNGTTEKIFNGDGLWENHGFWQYFYFYNFENSGKQSQMIDPLSYDVSEKTIDPFIMEEKGLYSFFKKNDESNNDLYPWTILRYFSTLLEKLDNNGNVIWRKNYSAYSPEQIDFSAFKTGYLYYYASYHHDGRALSNGDYVTVTNSYIYESDYNSDYYKYLDLNIRIICFDSNGNIKWEKSMPGGGITTGVLTIDNNDNIYYAYNEYIDVIENYYVLDTFLIKYDKNGNVIWKKEYDVSDRYEHVTSILRTQDRGFLIIGEYNEEFNQDEKTYPTFILKLDADGNCNNCGF